MIHKSILDIFTIIYKGRQRIGFKVQGIEKFLYLSPASVKQCTGVRINEVEILIGSKIRPVFYKKGEKMFGGNIYEDNYPIIKDFWIECSDTIEIMRNKNSDKLIDLKEIKKVFHFHKFGKNNIGFDVGEDKPIFTNAKRILALTSLDLSEIHILEGSYIGPEFYQKGENIYEGMDREPEICYRSGVLLKNLNLRFFGKIEEMHERFENSEPSYAIGYDNSSYDNNSSYDSSNWLANAAGTDDPEVMRDVYWNLD